MKCHLCNAPSETGCNHYEADKPKELSNADFAAFLKDEGHSTSEIIYLISQKEEGITLTKAIYDFTFSYDTGKIDGFPDSSIKVLAKYYGAKRLKKMKYQTLFEKVYKLQRCLIESPDDEEIKEAIEYYQK